VDRKQLEFALSLGLTFVSAGFVPKMAVSQAKPQPGKFFLGADISTLDAPSRRPLPAYQEDGKPSDELTILKHHGWTAFRVRVFVAPVRNAPNNTLENAIPLAKQIKASGATLVLDLHFSDTWADPQHQQIPVAWRGMDINALAKQWEEYAHDTIKAFNNAGAMPDIVQIGNEITRGTAWPLAQLQPPGSKEYNPPQPYDDALQWKHLTLLLKAGIRGVKLGAGRTQPRIAIHIDKGGHWDTTEWYFDHLNAAHVHYDIIAQSFYPPWGHGTLDDLWNNMNQCAKRYHKDFLVMETGYLPVRVPSKDDMLWPVTPEGRLQFMVDLVNTVKKAPGGLGVMYWAPERDLWNDDGSPGPAVYTQDNLTTLTKRPGSHAPTAVDP
jgi:arabinogalactan endo-1,4-beta-galactosidase